MEFNNVVRRMFKLKLFAALFFISDTSFSASPKTMIRDGEVWTISHGCELKLTKTASRIGTLKISSSGRYAAATKLKTPVSPYNEERAREQEESETASILILDLHKRIIITELKTPRQIRGVGWVDDGEDELFRFDDCDDFSVYDTFQFDPVKRKIRHLHYSQMGTWIPDED